MYYVETGCYRDQVAGVVMLALVERNPSRRRGRWILTMMREREAQGA
jgi:hypothetical protein